MGEPSKRPVVRHVSDGQGDSRLDASRLRFTNIAQALSVYRLLRPWRNSLITIADALGWLHTVDRDFISQYRYAKNHYRFRFDRARRSLTYWEVEGEEREPNHQARTRQREGVVIEAERMPDSSLLSQILFNNKGGRSEFLESITKAVAQIGGTPELAQQIRDLFDIDILSTFVGAWKQTLKARLDESTKAPEKVIYLSLAEHTIHSEHHPYVEIRVKEIAVKRMPFTLKVSFSLRGVILRIQNGLIKEIETGTCEATGTMLFQDIVIAEFSTPIRLPGLMSVPADKSNPIP